MTITGTLIMIPVLLLVMLLPLALFIVLQVWLCKRGGRLGLILPALTLTISLVLCLSLAAFGGVRGGSLQVTGEYGNVIQQQEVQERVSLTPGAAGAVTCLFLVTNVPSVIFMGIWLHTRSQRIKKDDLKRMSIEDLE